jgi:pre-mRNA-splicing factor RBM22/SLT11
VVAARPQSQVGVIYNAQLAERQVAGGALPYDRADYGAVVQKLARTQPYYQRNKAHICSFWVQGKCTRGDVCPYRHEMPTHDPKSDMAKQNIRDRYWGQDDPVAKKMLAKAQAHERPEAPEEVKSVFVGKVTADIKEEDIKCVSNFRYVINMHLVPYHAFFSWFFSLRDHFYSFGNVVNIRMVPTQTCAFIEYSSHDEAKKAIDSLQGKLIVKGQLLRVSWAKPQTAGEPSNGPPQDLAMPNFAPRTSSHFKTWDMFRWDPR